MNFNKKIGILIIVILISIGIFTSFSDQKKKPVETLAIKPESQQVGTLRVESPKIKENSDSKSDSPDTTTVAPEVSHNRSLVFNNFSVPEDKLAVPIAFLQSDAGEILDRLIELQVLPSALEHSVGHGYFSFPVKEISEFYPSFAEKLFKNLAIQPLSDFFWSEIAGEGKLFFEHPEIEKKLTEDLRLLGLSPEFISISSPEKLKIDLAQGGFKISPENSVKLNFFFQKNAQFFNTTQLSAEGTIAIMLTSLNSLKSNVQVVIEELSALKQLEKFFSILKVEGLLLLDLQTLRLYQNDLKGLIDVKKLEDSSFKMQKNSVGQYHHQIDYQKVAKNQEVNLKTQKELQEKTGITENFYQTFIDIPMLIPGSELLQYSRTISDLQENFLEQKFLAQGTTIISVFNFPLNNLGESLEPTFLDVLIRLGSDRLIKYSLENIEGEGTFFLPITLINEQREILDLIVDASATLVQKLNPKPSYKIYLEIPSSPETIALLDSNKYIILNRENFDGKLRINLTTNEPKRITIFKELASELKDKGVVLRGYLDLDLKLFKTDRHANLILTKLIAVGSIDMEKILKGIKGNGTISLYPDTSSFFNQQLIKSIDILFKNNQAAYERWKLIQGKFNLRVPENFNKEVESGSLPDMYQYLNKDNNPKAKEQRVKSLLQVLEKKPTSDLAVPQKLDEILDILSDERKISDVLKDKNG